MLLLNGSGRWILNSKFGICIDDDDDDEKKVDGGRAVARLTLDYTNTKAHEHLLFGQF